ncbi:DNA alkylation repair protein [Deminuibacter soli]|uniref:DNA alkylation repair protein n=1 Tax=Deminuibacter soli TaxID=2291815 RepID=A0A3E1NHB1_9BACT|nr:DNA alkylation repair protein [Deminuibacter soli]RFM27287.1 DNA alkylation repair protein [Deminuibacter soli]
MGLIKDVYSARFYNELAAVAVGVIPAFDKTGFVKKALSPAFKNMEWKERMLHTTQVLHLFMPKQFGKAAKLLVKLVDELVKTGVSDGLLPYIFLPEYVAMYGIDHFRESVYALEQITQFISAEFAVRPFLLKYGDEMIGVMTGWSTHKSAAVRRLASEGSRPRLPWALAIPALKKDPSPLLPLLENLKNDPSETVRRSVANNLNDIAKDHPGVALSIARKWKGTSAATDAIVKHGCRTLLKQGNPEVLALYGLTGTAITVSDFTVTEKHVKMGDSLSFTCTITNTGKKVQKVRLEYGIYYLRANGQLSRKVFKVSERDYAPGEVCTVTRRQSFKAITTRVFYPGKHEVSVIVNGEEKVKHPFVLK